jgi:hypothetical protein
MRSSVGYVGFCLVIGLALSACDKKSGPTSTSSADALTLQTRLDSANAEMKTMGDKYAALSKERDDIRHASYLLQRNSTEEQEALMEFHQHLEDFTYYLTGVPTRSNLKIRLGNIDYSAKILLADISKLETLLIKEWSLLFDNAPFVYGLVKQNQDHIADWQRRLEKKHSALQEMRTHLNNDLANYLALIKCDLGVDASIQTDFAFVAKKVEIKPEEVKFATIPAGTAFVPDPSGGAPKTYSTSTDFATAASASNMGFDYQAATNMFDMSAKTGGLATYSRAQDLGTSITQILANIKQKVQSNSDDLELVFALDYSGSMSDDIEGVIAGLKDITNSLAAFSSAHRQVRIGIVTFGLRYKEKRELDLEPNLVIVANKLAFLLDEYLHNPNASNSDDPGEVSYHGLNVVAEQMSWRSRNRMAILITDEPATEIVTSAFPGYADDVMQKLKRQGVQTTVYTILTPR